MKYKAKTLYNLNGQNTRPKMKEKPIQIFTRKSGPNLGPWAQKSTLRFMRTLRSCLAALTQSSWSLVSNTLGDVTSIRACRPRIFFINVFLCFLENEWQRNGEGREREEMPLQGEDESRRSSPP